MRFKLRNVFPVILIVAISFYALWPIVKNPFGSLVSGKEDVLVAWIINQNIKKIPHDFANIFQGNIFYPYKNTMAYSVMLLPSSLLSYFPVKIFDSFLVGFNFTLIAAQILSMLVSYLFFFEITKDRASSFLAAVAFCLSQIHMQFMTHLQTFIMQWWLMSVWMVWKFKKSGKYIYLCFAGIFTAIQFWENPLPVFWILFIAVLILGKKLFELLRDWKKIIPIAVIVFLLCYPLARTYYSVSRQFNYARPIREVAHFSMSLNDLWGRNFSSGLYGLLFVSLLMILSFWKESRSAGRLIESQQNLKSISAVGLVGLVMALGPVLKWQGETVKFFGKIFIPLPYGLFYYLLPGFKIVRAPALWILVFAFGVSGIIALAFSKYKTKSKNILVALALTLAVVGGRCLEKSVLVPTKDQYPKVYSWLQKQEDDVVLELPIYTWADGEVYHHQMYRMLYGLKHGKYLVDGVSGFIPPERKNLISRLKDFPSDELAEELKEIGVDYIVVHKNEYERKGLEEINSWGNEKKVFEDGDSLIYRL